MPRRVRLADLPKTPRGKNVQEAADISAEEIELDDVVVIKRHLFKRCEPGNPWYEGEGDDDDEVERPKSVVRKSAGLQRIRSLKERAAAIVSSPMVDARPRHGLSQSGDYSPTPTRLKVPHKNDLLHSTSRELSQVILSRRSSMASALRRPELVSPTLSKSSAEDLNLDICNKENVLPNQSTTNEDLNSIKDFSLLAQVEEARLRVLCNDWNAVISEESTKLPEPVVDSIRTTVGKCQLVLQHKIPFFHSLVDTAERCANGLDPDAPTTSANDLAGYWDMVADEIKRADDSFDRLRKWREEFNWDVAHCPITPPRRGPVSTKSSSKRGRTPKRVMATKVSKIPTRKSIRGREVLVGNVPKEAAGDLMTAAAQKSAQKKPRVGSKFAVFLKARKAASKECPGSPAPIMIYTSEKQSSGVHSTTAASESSPTVDVLHSFQTPGSGVNEPKPSQSSYTESNNSFIVPKHRIPKSDLRRKNLVTPNPLSSSSKSSSTPSRVVSQSSRIASTPLNPFLASNNPDFRTPKLPKSVGKINTQLSTGSRPGTPRPPPKRKSRVSSFADRVTLDSILSSSTDDDRKSLRPRTQPRREVKRISFAPDLPRTPGGRPGGSGSPRDPYPITPANTSGSLVAANRIHRRKNLLETLTPLGLRPVTSRKSLSMTK